MFSKNYRDQYRKPEALLYELIRKYAAGEISENTVAPTVFYRALVLAVDTVGGQLECERPNSNNFVEHLMPDGQKQKFEAIVGPKNPVNSIKARILTDGLDQFYGDSKVSVFWPMMQEHNLLPIKPGEHVYVIFEDPNKVHGMWFGKVAGHTGLNYVEGLSQYDEENDGNISQLFPEFAGGDPRKPLVKTQKSMTQTSIKEKKLSSKFNL